ncbi:MULTISPECIES: hypothetical protein [unclassified Microbacterium]|uniref:hypothetical protein n=1 Tax=unclassified Microbacterium TaxID=2609290 RepID=UPI00214CA320|nr:MULTISPECIES: hypothetical protein [unclassified Microbacterium]MCR2785431.1 hypothetical protein [Microbacterium sp. zg.B96]WIM14542.1 hypothetical protein QNO11_08105 [Microbacterium sp. zg-B96]
MAQMLAAGHPRNALLLPRRSSKTTTLNCEALGRAYHREDYRVAILTLTTGKAGRSRFLKDVVPALERIGASFGEDKRLWPFKLVKSAGSERVEFRGSGGMVSWLSSIDDLRGEAFDLVILDEAQAADVEKAQEVIAAALPTMDTRPGAQIVVAGTAGEFRKGNLLWDWLEDGREGKAGIVEYGVPDDTAPDLFDSWETVEALILAAHPGIGNLTTLETIKSNYDALGVEKFAREYLSVFGKIGEGAGVLNQQRWLESAASGTPEIPDHFAIGAACSFTQGFSSLVAAWRDEDGKAHGYVLDHRKGTTWLADAGAKLSITHNLPIVYDSASSPMRVEVEAMQHMQPTPWLAPQNFPNVTTAAALVTKSVNTGNAVHYSQPAMSDAAKIAVRRSAGASWALGRPPKDPDADISALEAWALALRFYDENPPHVAIRPIMAA